MIKELNIFVDPKTQTPLTLKVEKVRGKRVFSGTLCNQRKEYPIIAGIPRFVEQSFYKESGLNSGENLTARSFGTKWSEKRYQKFGLAAQDLRSLTEQFKALLGCQTLSQLKRTIKGARRVLNAGCGVAWSEYLFNYHSGTERHCVDISRSVELAYKKTKNFKNVIVAQASIFSLPYADNTFDIIYSLGVIHHTANPKKALLSLVKKLIPKGLIGIYIYNKKPFIREIMDAEIRKLTTKMCYKECMDFSKRITKLGEALNKIKQPIFIKERIDLLNIPRGKYSVQRFINDYFVKCWHNPKQDKGYADLVNQDWYHPYYASHHTKEEVMSWFKKAGLENITCIQPKGWQHSGYFISGRKR